MDLDVLGTVAAYAWCLFSGHSVCVWVGVSVQSVLVSIFKSKAVSVSCMRRLLHGLGIFFFPSFLDFFSGSTCFVSTLHRI